MTSRQRGPPMVSTRQTNGPYNYTRQGTTEERESIYNDPYGDRSYLSARGGSGREGHLEGDGSMSNQYAYRSRTDSNSSLPIENARIPRAQMTPEESRGRGSSM